MYIHIIIYMYIQCMYTVHIPWFDKNLPNRLDKSIRSTSSTKVNKDDTSALSSQFEPPETEVPGIVLNIVASIFGYINLLQFFSKPGKLENKLHAVLVKRCRSG